MVYKNEYSTRRVYTNSSPSPGVASSFSYTLGSGRAGSVPRVAIQKLAGSAAPPRSSLRLNQLYSELEDEVASNSHLGSLVSFRRSVTPGRGSSPLRSLSPIRSVTPGPIRSITYHSHATQPAPQLASLQELQSQSLMRSRTDDVLLHLALGLSPPLYSLHHIPLRSALDVKEACDVRRQFVHERNMYDPLSRAQSEIYRMAFNRRPRRVDSGYIAGNGTLACLSYAGGRPIAKRRRFYPDEETKVVDDLKFNNYYKPSAVGSYYSTAGKKPSYQPIYRSKKSLLGLPDTPDSYRKADSKWETKLSIGRRPASPPRISPPRRVVSASTEPRKPASAPSDNIIVTLPRPRKSVSDLPEDFVPPPSPTQQLPVPEESVVFKIPRKSVSQEPPELSVQKDDEEEVTQVVKIKRPSLKPTPSPEPEVQSEPIKETEASASAEPEPSESTSVVETDQEAKDSAKAEPEEEAEPAVDPTPAPAEPAVDPTPAPAAQPDSQPDLTEETKPVDQPEPVIESEPQNEPQAEESESSAAPDLDANTEADAAPEKSELVEEVPEEESGNLETATDTLVEEKPAEPVTSSGPEVEENPEGNNVQATADEDHSEQTGAAEELTEDVPAENATSETPAVENLIGEAGEDLEQPEEEIPSKSQNEQESASALEDATEDKVEAEAEDADASQTEDLPFDDDD